MLLVWPLKAFFCPTKKKLKVHLIKIDSSIRMAPPQGPRCRGKRWKKEKEKQNE